MSDSMQDSGWTKHHLIWMLESDDRNRLLGAAAVPRIPHSGSTTRSAGPKRGLFARITQTALQQICENVPKTGQPRGIRRLLDIRAALRRAGCQQGSKTGKPALTGRLARRIYRQGRRCNVSGRRRRFSTGHPSSSGWLRRAASGRPHFHVQCACNPVFAIHRCPA